MSNERRRPRKLNVGRELLRFAAMLDALRVAAEQALQGSYPPREFASGMAGSLHVLRDRLQLLERVLSGITNPREILCSANEADVSEDGPGIVPEWSHDEEVQRLEAEWRGARYRRDAARESTPKRLVHAKKPSGKSN